MRVRGTVRPQVVIVVCLNCGASLGVAIIFAATLDVIEEHNSQKLPGVVAVVTGEEVAAHCGPVPCVVSMPNLKPAYRQLLAVGKVRFVGEPVAAVVAENKYINLPREHLF